MPPTIPAIQSQPCAPGAGIGAETAGKGGAVGFLVVEQRSTTPVGPRIVYANAELSRLSGYEFSSLIGSPLGLLYDRSDLPVLIEKLPVIAARPNHCYMDRVLMRNGGTRLPCHWTIRPTNRDGEPHGYFALTVRPILARDTTPLASTNKAAAWEVPAIPSRPEPEPRPADPAPAPDYEACRNESISLAAGGVAHDFKNALQTIKNNLELAAHAVPPGSQAFGYIGEAQLALGDAELLARQMLAFTRGESGRRRVLHLGHLLERVSRLCSAGSGIRCRLSLEQDLRCVEGDPAQVYQVLHNLVINARQAMPNGGTIDIVAANANLLKRNKFGMPAGRYTVTSVRDRGCGISPENLTRIFEPDFTTKADGNGFGLASCEAIIANHGGAIRVASKVGVGTEFLVFLPSTEERAEPDPAWVAPPAHAFPGRACTPGSGSGRILVVEDQPGVARSTMKLLGQLGYESLEASNGQQALSIFREHFDSTEPVNAVLLDMTLPGGLSGLEVAAELLRIDPFVRIVATSGYFEENSELRAGAEFVAVLPKPYGIQDLAEAIALAVAV